MADKMVPLLCVEDIHAEAVKKLKKSHTGTTHYISEIDL